MEGVPLTRHRPSGNGRRRGVHPSTCAGHRWLHLNAWAGRTEPAITEVVAPDTRTLLDVYDICPDTVASLLITAGGNSDRNSIHGSTRLTCSRSE